MEMRRDHGDDEEGKGQQGREREGEIGPYKQNYYKELIHVIIDAKKFQGLLMESLNPRKAMT